MSSLIALSASDFLRLTLLFLFSIFFFLKEKYFWIQKYFSWMLIALVFLGAMAHFNFFTFHPGGTHLHNLEMYHYYMGSQYFPELGYTKLYEASLIADSEDDRYFRPELPLRSLETYELVPRKKILEKKEEIVARFTPKRWKQFREDLSVFRMTAPTQWGVKFGYGDHGYNGSPLVTGVLSTISSQKFLNTQDFIHLAAWFDPFIVFFSTVLIAGLLGGEAALIFLFFTLVNPLNDYAMIGGAYLRYLSFGALALGIACYRLKRFAWSGILFAVASALRIFPLFFLPAIFVSSLLKKEGLAHLKSTRPFYFFFFITAFAILILTSQSGDAHPRNAWLSFQKQMQLHRASVSPNQVGLKSIFSFSPRHDIQKVLASWPHGERLNWAVENQKTFQERKFFYGGILAAVFLAGIVFLKKAEGPEVFLAGSLLIFCGLNLSHYYYCYLSLLPLMLWEEKKSTLLIAGALGGMILLTSFPAFGGTADRRFFWVSLVTFFLLLSLLFRRLFALKVDAKGFC